MLKVEHLSHSFKKKEVLHNISLELQEGIYGLLGPNGSGKTTLMRCITGVLHPTKGAVEIPEKLGYLPQRFGIFRELTAYEALAYFATLKEIPKEQLRDAVMTSLEYVHLADRANDKIKALSGGMVRRMGIAQALLGDPRLVLVDEPTAGLDPEERLRFKNMISGLRKGHTVLISTHIVEDVESLCDHIIIMQNGSLLCQDTAEGIRGLAEGMVYSVPASDKDALISPYTLLRDEYIAGEQRFRVLSAVAQPGVPIPPTVEDGYMSRIREVL